MEVKVFKKFATVGLLSIALIAGVTTPAHAAVKQGSACTKALAKTTVGKKSYICSTNPTSTSKKLVWLMTDCFTEGKNLGSLNASLAAYTKQSSSAIITMEKNLVDAKAKLVQIETVDKPAAETALYTVGADMTKPKVLNKDGKLMYPDVQVAGRLAAIEILTQKMNAAKNANNKAIFQRTIDQLKAIPTQFDKAITALNRTITTTTGMLASLKDAQTENSSAYAEQIRSSKSILKSICKTGL
ncbi:MAG: hypothetical protein RL414_811 [Actinomycetota bacterium]